MNSVVFILCGTKNMKNRRFINALLIVTPLLVGVAALILTKDMSAEYEQLQSPLLSPPSAVFPIVWTILYLLMGISAALIYSKPDYLENRTTGLTLHIAQLVLNFFWSMIFFNLGKYYFAFVWLIILWLVVFSMMLNYRTISKTAFFLNVPYIVWLTFAGYLNLGFAILN